MNIMLIGASGGLGMALLAHYQRVAEHTIFALSRQPKPGELSEQVNWYQVDGELAGYQAVMKEFETQQLEFQLVISTIGWLHQGDWQPERRIESLNEAQLNAYFAVNATLPIMLLQAIKPLLAKQDAAVVAQLGAKVGSINDNELGGWYGYRASKAALNMFYKTAAIEFKRTHKSLCLAVIHPGTTDTELSKPFQKRIAPGKLYSKEQSAQRIAAVIAKLDASKSGGFWFWDGSPLPY